MHRSPPTDLRGTRQIRRQLLYEGGTVRGISRSLNALESHCAGIRERQAQIACAGRVMPLECTLHRLSQ